MKNLIFLKDYVVDQESKDYSKSRNGGEYEFGHYPVMYTGKEVGRLLATSSSFDYCQLGGGFTKVKRIDVKDTDIVFFADAQLGIDDYISIDQFLKLINH